MSSWAGVPGGPDLPDRILPNRRRRQARFDRLTPIEYETPHDPPAPQAAQPNLSPRRAAVLYSPFGQIPNGGHESSSPDSKRFGHIVELQPAA